MPTTELDPIELDALPDLAGLTAAALLIARLSGVTGKVSIDAIRNLLFASASLTGTTAAAALTLSGVLTTNGNIARPGSAIGVLNFNDGGGNMRARIDYVGGQFQAPQGSAVYGTSIEMASGGFGADQRPVFWRSAGPFQPVDIRLFPISAGLLSLYTGDAGTVLGSLNVATLAAGNNSTKTASTAYVDAAAQAVKDQIINGASGLYDTLLEVAAKFDATDSVVGSLTSAIATAQTTANTAQSGVDMLTTIVNGHEDAITGLLASQYPGVVYLTDSRGLTTTDHNKILVNTTGTAITLTYPAGLTTGFSITMVNQGAGSVKVLATAETTQVFNKDSHTGISGDATIATLLQFNTGQAILAGQTSVI